MTVQTTPACAELRQASVHHPRRGQVVRVDLVVRPGRVVAVTGPSGAGKSLLLRAVVGFEQVQEGQALLFGTALEALDHDRLLALRQRVAYASLSAALLSNRSTRDNLRLPLVYRGVERGLARALVEQVMQTLGLEGVAELRPHQFPLRLLTLAIIARALVLPAQLYVFDEPSHDLDDETLAVLHSEIAARRDNGAGILLSLDDPDRWHGLVDDELRLPGPPASPQGAGEAVSDAHPG